MKSSFLLGPQPPTSRFLLLDQQRPFSPDYQSIGREVGYRRQAITDATAVTTIKGKKHEHRPDLNAPKTGNKA